MHSVLLMISFLEEKPNQWYNHYKIIHVENQNETIVGLEFIFIEIPKFKPISIVEKILTVLWLRYLSELQKHNDMYDEELLKEMMEVPEIAKALELSKESAYTKEELEAYDRYWDSVRVQKAYITFWPVCSRIAYKELY